MKSDKLPFIYLLYKCLSYSVFRPTGASFADFLNAGFFSYIPYIILLNSKSQHFACDEILPASLSAGASEGCSLMSLQMCLPLFPDIPTKHFFEKIPFNKSNECSEIFVGLLYVPHFGWVQKISVTSQGLLAVDF